MAQCRNFSFRITITQLFHDFKFLWRHVLKLHAFHNLNKWEVNEILEETETLYRNELETILFPNQDAVIVSFVPITQHDPGCGVTP